MHVNAQSHKALPEAIRSRIFPRMNGEKTSQLAKNLEFLLKQEKLSAYELAQRTKVPQPTIFRILTGESQDPKSSTVAPLADYFKVPAWVLRDTDIEAGQATGEPGQKAPALSVVQSVPRGMVDGDDLIELMVLFQQADADDRKFILNSARSTSKAAVRWARGGNKG